MILTVCENVWIVDVTWYKVISDSLFYTYIIYIVIQTSKEVTLPLALNALNGSMSEIFMEGGIEY